VIDDDDQETDTRSRYLGTVTAGMRDLDDILVQVDHIFGTTPEVRDCGRPHADPGLVGLTVAPDGADPEDPSVYRLLLTAEAALVLANRLQRAASLSFEADEGLPDTDREAIRLQPGRDCRAAGRMRRVRA